MSQTYTIDQESLKLLRQIEGGIRLFEPLRRSSPELVEFQLMVGRLLELENLGLVGRCITQQQEARRPDLLRPVHGLHRAHQ